MGKTLLFLFFLASLSFAQLLGPKLAVQQPVFDFGEIKQGELAVHEFIISNTGDDLLIIKDVRPSCGCTAAKPDKDTLKPGESTKIKVQFNTAGREGFQQKAVYLTTNDKENPEYKLKFNATVVLSQTKQGQNSTSTTHN